jgi:aminoglycoside 6'-N-acetyltransferase
MAKAAPVRISLRLAVPGDLALLRYWDTKPHVIAATGEDEGDFQWESELARRVDWREFLIAEANGRAVGFLQIIDPAREESHYWGNIEADLRAIDIWIGEESDLGRGYGGAMMRLAIARCFTEPAVRAIIVDPLASNLPARRFYERLGFREVGRSVFEIEECAVYRLDREDWERDRRP